MDREHQIDEAADFWLSDKPVHYTEEHVACWKAGARWADAHPLDIYQKLFEKMKSEIRDIKTQLATMKMGSEFHTTSLLDHSNRIKDIEDVIKKGNNYANITNI